MVPSLPCLPAGVAPPKALFLGMWLRRQPDQMPRHLTMALQLPLAERILKTQSVPRYRLQQIGSAYPFLCFLTGFPTN